MGHWRLPWLVFGLIGKAIGNRRLLCPGAQLFVCNWPASHLLGGTYVVGVHQRAQHRDFIAQSTYIAFQLKHPDAQVNGSIAHKAVLLDPIICSADRKKASKLV